MRGGAPPDRILMRTRQDRDRLTQLTVGRQPAVQVGIDAEDVGQRHRVGVIGLRPGDRMAFAVAGYCQWIGIQLKHIASRALANRSTQGYANADSSWAAHLESAIDAARFRRLEDLYQTHKT